MKFDDEYFRKKRDTDADAAAEDTEDAAENKKESKTKRNTRIGNATICELK